MSIKLTILVPTIPNRIELFYPKLMKNLINQTKKYDNVELIAFFDNKKRSIGKKRQEMLNLTQGEYVVFVDDDDRVADDYVDQIMTALNDNPGTDCVVFNAFCRINGDSGRPCRHGIEYENFTSCGSELRGKPPHTAVYRTAISKKHSFSDRGHGEDIDWINRACQDIKIQTRIEKVLYFYDAEYETTSETVGIPDHIIEHNINLKLQNEKNMVVQNETNTIVQNNSNTNNYGITVAVRDPDMAYPVLQSLAPMKANVLIGKDYPSFSKLVNTVISNTKEEIVIFCSHRVRPTPSDVDRILNLLKEGYGLVGLYRLAFFGLKKELIRRIGFMDERFIGGSHEDNDFVIRLNEANIAYYEDESVEYHASGSTWDSSRTREIYFSKWNITGNIITRLKEEITYDYDLGVNNELQNIETKKLFLPWNNSRANHKQSLVRDYFNMKVVSSFNIIPIHLRNVPPPMETFDHPSFLAQMAKWIKPNLYVEFGIRHGTSLEQIAPYCKKIHGVDINPINSELTNQFPQLVFHQMTTDEYVSDIINKMKPSPNIDMIFIDACHESNQVFKDFEGIFPFVMEDGFIFLHDTYPYNICMTAPDLCNDCYRVPYLIKNKYSNMCEMVTLPFNPGLTIIKKKTTMTPACFQ